MSDFLYDSAKAYDKLLDYNYKVLLGNAKRIESNITVHIVSENFTHVVGLDHLYDIYVLKSKNTKVKDWVYHEILTGNFNFQNIKASIYFNDPFAKTYNSQTKSEYTITERIMAMQNIEKYLDNAFSGKFGGEVYKWNVRNSRIRLPNGKIKNSAISADYLIVTQSERNPDEKIYFFTYLDNSGNFNDNSKHLYIFSAFPDCVDLTQGQRKEFTILQAEKINIKENTSQLLYIRPSYQKQLSSQPQQQDNNNINQVKFDSPMKAPNVRISGGAGEIVADSPSPSHFKDILKKIKNRLGEIFKPKDKTSPQIMTTHTVDMPNTPDETVAEAEIKTDTKPVSKEFAALIEARETFAEGSISQEEYRQAVKDFMHTLQGEKMWIEAADTLRSQFDNCPEEMKKYIGYELKNLEINIDKKFAPKRQQTFDELSKAAKEKYIKLQKEKETVEIVSSHSDKNRNER